MLTHMQSTMDVSGGRLKNNEWTRRELNDFIGLRSKILPKQFAFNSFESICRRTELNEAFAQR